MINPAGNASVVLSAGEPHDNYLWSTGETISTINVTNAGSVILSTVGSNGCTGMDTIVIQQQKAVLNPSAHPATICAGQSAQLKAGLISGSGNLTTAVYYSGFSDLIGGWGEVGVCSPSYNAEFSSASPRFRWFDNGSGIPQSVKVEFVPLNESSLVGTVKTVYFNNNNDTTAHYIVTSSGGDYCSQFITNNKITLNLTPSFYNIGGENAVNVSSSGSWGLANGFYAGIGGWQQYVKITVTYLSFNGKYTWTPGGDSAENINVSPDTTTTYTITADKDGCIASDTVTLNITPLPIITAGGPTDNLCPSDSVLLTSTPANSYLWNTGDTTRSITVHQGGNYSVTANNCSVAAPVTVSYKATPVIALNGPSSICPGYSITLTASDGDSYLWSTNDTSRQIQVSAAGNYSVTVTTNECPQTTSQEIIVRVPDKPVLLSYSGKNDICSSHEDMAGYYSIGNYTEGFVYTSNSDSLVPGYFYYLQTAYPGTYTITGKDALGCTVTSDPIVVTEAPGNPDVFGNNVWNVYLFDNAAPWGFDDPWKHYVAEDISYSGYPETLNPYHGYYVDNNLSFDTRNKWDPDGSPATTPGFMGCDLSYDDYFSWTAKRKGFPCGNYNITIPVHDDDAELYVNGVLVWQQAGFVIDSTSTVWQGVLGPTSTVEFRVRDYSGGCVGVINLTLTDSNIVTKPTVTPAGPIAICSASPATLTSSAGTGNTWSNGATAQAISVNTAGNYFVTVTGSEGCTAQSNTVQVSVTAAATYYADADGDGYGNPNVSVSACTKPAGYVTNKTDCDDTKASVHPGAVEICDGIDNDCDGLVDEGFAKTTYYRDADGDGYGNPAISLTSCSTPAGYVTNKKDCNDSNAAVHPGAVEICDGIDNNCDGRIDEGFAKITYYRDADGDGYGNPAISVVTTCTAPAGYVTNRTDCNDSNAAVHPGAPEICDGIDNNCDGRVDEGFTKITYYRDADGDGYGNAAIKLVAACAQPAGYVTNNKDCNDSDASIHPGALEICGGKDNNCDGRIDEGFAKITYYRDADGDGYGNAAITLVASCGKPDGYVTNKTDCNDSNAAIHPGAIDICDGIDNDCDGKIDEDCPLITINDVAITEGNTGQKSMNFTVTLATASLQTTKVNYTTQDITTTAGIDYVAQSGVLSFAPGVRKLTISILINGDRAPESNETFKVLLSNPVNATLSDDTGIGTITNDDGTLPLTAARVVDKTASPLVPEKTIRLTPNPASAFVTVELKGYSDATIQLRNINGVVLKEEKLQEGYKRSSQVRLNVAGYPNGVYLVVVVDEKGITQMKKLILER